MKASPGSQLLERYTKFVETHFAAHIRTWPLISNFGHRVLRGQVDKVLVYIFFDDGGALQRFEGIGQIPSALIDADHIDEGNKEAVRAKLISRYGVDQRGAVFFEGPGIDLENEFEMASRRHRKALGMNPERIFLSHKGADKDRVRDFKATLQLLGFSPWLDEDAMRAGVPLNRSILQGFDDSCAAVFFVTPNFKDEKYLADEVDYAIDQKHKKGDAFSIITLVFELAGKKGDVPALLRKYVWKEPRSGLEALREILHALPLRVGDVHWR